ncbi:MAG: flagellar biosynthesis protein FlhB [Candidatus Sericytochromatia bacterium]|nr:flagellar biosynthesis protein FlhB [Candidatus Sericytochromatia bacterium]
MAESGGQERTEKPTPRRLQEARKKGNIARSMDVNTAVVLLAAITGIRLQFDDMGTRLLDLAREAFSVFPRDDMTVGMLHRVFVTLGWEFFLIVGPCLLMLMGAGLVANYLQVGVIFTTEPLRPSLEKINPIAGFKRILSLRSVVEVLKAIVKMIVVAIIAYRTIEDRYDQLVATVLMDREGVAWLYGDLAWTIGWRAVLALVFFAALDFFYQRWEYERGLRMTKQEIKDEAKQSEGDPIVRGRIRRAQREAARRRMMADVPSATVVVTNPTHVAVALKYDRDSMVAPVVVAKGLDLIAQRIKTIAAEAGVPMIENVPLARELYRRLEIQDEIPEDLYAAVAEILVMVQKLNSRGHALPTAGSGLQMPADLFETTAQGR